MKARVVFLLTIMFVLALCQAVASISPPELVDLRTETAKFYPGDGATRGEFFTGPVHYKDSKGKWQDIDVNFVDLNRVRDDNDDLKRLAIGVSAVQAPVVSAIGVPEDPHGQPILSKRQFGHGILRNRFGFFAPQNSGGFFVLAMSDQERIAFRAMDTQRTAPRFERNFVTYKEAWPGADLQYIASATLLKENIIIRRPDAPARYSFKLKTYGVEVRQNAAGSIEFIDGNGKAFAYLTEPFMRDAKGEISRQIQLNVTAERSLITFELIPDSKWLADPTRSYPVVLDPTTVYCSPTGDAGLSQYDCDSALGEKELGSLDLGVYRGIFIPESRNWVLLKFDLKALPTNTYIKSAALQMYCYEATGDCSTSFPVSTTEYALAWDEMTVTWRNSGVSSLSLPTDPKMGYLPNATGSWTKIISPTLIDSLVDEHDPLYSMLVWTWSEKGYIRRFRSQNYSNAEQRPKLMIEFSHLPEARNYVGQHLSANVPEMPELLDKLKYRVYWETVFPYVGNTGHKFPCQGQVTISSGTEIRTEVSNDTAEGAAHTVEFTNSPGFIELKPNKTYDASIKSWCNCGCYDSADPKSSTTLSDSFDTFLEFTEAVQGKASELLWHRLENGHEPPVATPGVSVCTVAYSTNTYAKTRVEYWKMSSPNIRFTKDDALSGDGYRHIVELNELDNLTTYGYRIITYFTWDNSDADVTKRMYSVVSADGEFSTLDVTYSALNLSTTESRPPLLDVTFRWQTKTSKPDQPSYDTNGILYLGLSPTNLSRVYEDATNEPNHEVVVQNLSPGVTYYYRLGCKDSATLYPATGTLSFTSPMTYRGAEGYHNLAWRDLGAKGRMGVNTGNGNLVAAKAHFALAGRGPVLATGQFFNGNLKRDSVLGPGWSLTYDSTIAVDAFGWAVQTHDDGSSHVFQPGSVGAVAKGEFSTIARTAEGYQVTYKDGIVFIYSPFGDRYHLTEIRDRFGRSLFISRDPYSARILSLRRSSSEAEEMTFYYSSGYLDYILTRPDPATGIRHKINVTVNVTRDVAGNALWSEVRFTQPYNVSQPDEHWTTYHMDLIGNNVYIAGPDGARTTVSMSDGKANVISDNYTYYGETGTSRSGSAVMSHIFQIAGDLATVTDGRGNQIRYHFNPDLTVESIAYPDRSSQSFTYNGQFQPVSVTQSKKPGVFVTTRFEYDMKGNVLKQIGDYQGTSPNTANNTIAFTYEPRFSQVATVRDPRQYALDSSVESCRFTYDPALALLQVIEPKGSASLKPANYRIELEYNGSYDVRYKKVCNTNTVLKSASPDVIYEYGYDAFGQLEAVFYLENGDKACRRLVAFYRHDMFGNPLYQVEANGSIVRYDYTNHGLLHKQTRPLALNDDSRVNNSAERTYVNSRLSMYGVSLAVEPMNEPNADFTYQAEMAYDDMGRTISQKDAMERYTFHEYDEIGRLVKVTSPLSTMTYYHYDAAGNLEWKRYPVQNTYSVVRHYYDSMNREYMSMDPSTGAEHEFKCEFDLAGNVEVLYRGYNSSNGTYFSKTVHEYDNLFRCVRTQYLDSAGATTKTVSTTYDRNGNAIGVLEPVFAPSGIDHGMLNRTRVYDAVSRLVQETIAPQNANYPHYAGTTVFEHGGGRLLSETVTGQAGQPDKVTRYQYDCAGRIMNLVDGQKTFAFSYYPNGSRRTLVYGTASNPSFMTANYQYDRASRLMNLMYTWKNGVSRLGYSYTHLKDGRVHTSTETGAGNLATEVQFVDDADRPLDNFRYLGSNLYPMASRVITYGYDDLGRLTSASLPKYCDRITAATYSWSYDGLGNRKEEIVHEGAGSYEYESEEGTKTRQIEASTKSITYAFDALTGNRVRSGSGTYLMGGYQSDITIQYGYDAIGAQTSQYTEYRGESSFSSTRVTSTYSELGKVCQQTVLGTAPKKVQYYYDGAGALLREDDRYYFYGSGGVSRIMAGTAPVRHDYARLGGQVLASSDGFFYIVNGRGDVTALVSDASGDVLAYYVYEPFGGLRAAQKKAEVFNKFKYASGLQGNAGNYVFGARLYAPGNGQWISPDPYRGSMEDPLSLHRYAYCGNDPVNYVDPSGYQRRTLSKEVYVFDSEEDIAQWTSAQKCCEVVKACSGVGIVELMGGLGFKVYNKAIETLVGAVSEKAWDGLWGGNLITADPCIDDILVVEHIMIFGNRYTRYHLGYYDSQNLWHTRYDVTVSADGLGEFLLLPHDTLQDIGGSARLGNSTELSQSSM